MIVSFYAREVPSCSSLIFRLIVEGSLFLCKKLALPYFECQFCFRKTFDIEA
jgi:hypothetical protein